MSFLFVSLLETSYVAVCYSHQISIYHFGYFYLADSDSEIESYYDDSSDGEVDILDE